ncbi:MAG: response regulator [Acidobacteriota bacterium]
MYKGDILIVDDDINDLELLSEMLAAHQYDIRICNSGQRALAAVKSSPPDLVLLDINMPDMNGYKVCQRFKADPDSQHVPVIFISSNNDIIDKVQAFSAGGVDYITKPFQIEEVVARVEAQLKVARLSQQIEMQMLRYQLDPHFLFNTLISVRALVPLDNEPLRMIITQLSNYLHYMLMNGERLEISAEEELEAAQNYLALEKIRFEDKLIIKTVIEPQLGKYRLPAFLLQPLLENAVKYGMRTSPTPLAIELAAYRKESALCFSITNTGHWLRTEEEYFPEAASLGVGLQNVRRRLKQCYPGCHVLNIEELPGRVRVTVELPAREE